MPTANIDMHACMDRLSSRTEGSTARAGTLHTRHGFVALLAVALVQLKRLIKLKAELQRAEVGPTTCRRHLRLHCRLQLSVLLTTTYSAAQDDAHFAAEERKAERTGRVKAEVRALAATVWLPQRRCRCVDPTTAPHSTLTLLNPPRCSPAPA